MDFLKEYLAALGGTATALAVVKVLGETILKHWYKKDEIRLEKKLDALAAKDETRFNYHFTNRADASKEIFRQATSVVGLAVGLLYGKQLPLQGRTAEFDAKLRDDAARLQEEVNVMAGYSTSVGYLFDFNIKQRLLVFYGVIAVLIASPPEITLRQSENWCNNIRDVFRDIEEEFRKFLN